MRIINYYQKISYTYGLCPGTHNYHCVVCIMPKYYFMNV